MKNIILLIILAIVFTSCEKNEIVPEVNYKFDMVGRCVQDINGYYHLPINSIDDKQTFHRIGANITSEDKWGIPAQVIWTCDKFWYLTDTIGYTYIEIGQVPTGASPFSFQNFAVDGFAGYSVPVIYSSSYADSMVDSVFAVIAPIGMMKGDTVEVFGKAVFEEGDINMYDSINIIFE